MIVRAVLIDLDDTLWATTRNNQSALREVYEARGWSRWIDSFETLRDVYQPINDHLWHLYRVGEITKPELTVRRFKEPLEHFMGPLDEQLLDEINRQFLSLTATKKETIPGAIELLQELRRRYRIVILSNGFMEVQHRKMAAAGILPYVDCIVLSGDDWESDIQGADNAGLPAIWFNLRGQARPDEPLRVPLYEVSRLSEIPPLLRSFTSFT